MTPESILDAALKKTAGLERDAFLEGACANNAALRLELDALLRAHDSSSQFMAKPAIDQTAVYAQPAVQAVTKVEMLGEIGPYKLLEKLGEGGMGTVYVADQKEPVQRRVAIKLIKGGVDNRALMARFEQERQALAVMDHPNIAKVLDAGVHENTPYFVMELIKGVPITKYCDEAKLTPRERLELFIPVCHAVQHAHQKGIIHRDLKPSNILIGLYDGKPIPKIIDFGVAKATGSRLTEQSIYTEIGSIIGTLEYMSPEQAELNNLDIDTRTDIYALGIILYELLTGTVPFSQKEFAQAGMVKMLMMIKEVEPPKPSTKLSTSGALPSIAATRKMEPKKLTSLIKGDLDWIIMKTLEKERNRRYETANALAADINRYLNNEMVLAARPSLGYRARKFIRRNKLAAIAALIVATTLVATALIQTWSLLRAIDAEKKAVKETGEKTIALKQAVEEREAKEKALIETQKERDARDAALLKSDGLRLAAEATLIRKTNPGLSMLLGMEAVKRYPHHLSYDALFGASEECRELKTLQIKDHNLSIIRISPDKTRMLTAGDSRSTKGIRQCSIVFWSLADLKPLFSWHGYLNGIGNIDWSPDGSRIVVTSKENMAVDFLVASQRKQARFTNCVAYVIDAQSGKTLFQLRRHDDAITSVQFSPDGKKIVTASLDKKAKVWDAQSGKLLLNLEADGALQEATFSHDSKKILAVTSNHNPVPNRARDRFGLSEDAIDNPDLLSGDVKLISWSSGGSNSWSVYRSTNAIGRIWDAVTGQEISVLKKKSNSLFSTVQANLAIRMARFTPNDEKVLMIVEPGVTEHVICFWDASKGGFEKSSIDSWPKEAWSAISPRLARLAVGTAENMVIFCDIDEKWFNDAADMKKTRTVKSLSEYTGNIRLTRFSSDEKLFLAAGYNGAMQVWDPASGLEIVELFGHEDLQDVAFHPDNQHVVSVGGGTLRLWRLQSLPPLTQTIPTLPPVETENKTEKSLKGYVSSRTYTTGRRDTSLTFSRDGSQLLIGNDDRTASLWNIHTGKHIATTKFLLGGSLTRANFHISQNEVNFSVDQQDWWKTRRQSEGPVRLSAFYIWNWEKGPEAKILKEQNFGIRYYQWSPDRSRLLLVSNGTAIDGKGSSTLSQGNEYLGRGGYGEVSVWDVSTGTRICYLEEPAERDSLPGFSPDGKKILLCVENGQWFGWFDTTTGKLIQKYDPPNSPVGGAWQHAFLSPDGKTLIARRRYHKSPVCFWNATTHEYLGESEVIDNSNYRNLFQVSPDSKRVAVGSGTVVQLIDISTRKIAFTLRGHEKDITCMTFSPDGKFLLTGSEDKSAVLWNVETGKIVHVYKGHPDAVLNVAFSPAGTHVVTQSTEALVRIWPVDLLPLFEKRIQREFTPQERNRYELPLVDVSKTKQ